MKKFKTLSEMEILYAAHAHFLDRALSEQGKADKLKGKNSLSNARAQKAWSRERELSDEIIRLERKKKK